MNTLIHKLTAIITFAIIISSSYFLIINRNLYPIPNSDIFQYINDSHYYLSGELPPNIHAPPGNPILLGVFIHLFSLNHIQSVELAIWLNIILTTLSGIVYYFLFIKNQSALNFLGLLIILTHPITLATSLDATSEVFFTFVILFAVYLYKISRTPISIVIALGSFFIRYEGLAILFPLMKMTHSISKFRFIKLSALILLTLLPYLYSLNSHNLGTSIVDNTFIHEVKSDINKLPNFTFVHQLSQTLVSSLPISSLPQMYGSYILLIVIILGIFSKPVEYRILAQFILLYLCIHFIYPFSNDRYFYPLIWTTTPLLCHLMTTARPFIKSISVLIVLLAIYWNTSNIPTLFDTKKHENLQYKTLYEWINKQSFPIPTLVVTSEPWISSFFNTNQSVLYAQFTPSDYAHCPDISCLLSLTKYADNNQTLIVLFAEHTADEVQRNYYQRELGHHLFNDFYRNHTNQHRLIHEQYLGSSFIQIYKW